MNTKTRITIATALLALSVTTVSAETKAQEVLESLKPSTPKVGGLLNGRYAYDSSDKSNSFDIRRLRLAVSGDFGKSVDYKLQAEYGGGSSSSAATVKLLDAYLRVKIAKGLNIQAGEFKVAYSQETLDGPATWLTIENPTVVNKLNGYSDESGQSANSRDVGLRLYGSFGHKKGYDLVTYKLGVYNGNGINLKDNDKYKDVEAFITFNPVKELTLSAGQYIGRYTKVSGSEKATATRNRTSAGFTYKPGNLTLRSEYLYGKTGTVSHQGVYATAAYLLPHGIQPLLSYGYYQKDKETAVDNQADYLVGANWWASKNLRLQLNYTFTKYTNSTKKNRNLVEAQITASF